MINGNLENFLDTGWYCESTLYYNGFVYWLEATTTNGITTFFINRWKSGITDNKYYNTYIDSHGEPISYECVLTISETDIDRIKKLFLESNVFDGKSFWEVENELIWVDEGESITGS